MKKLTYIIIIPICLVLTQCNKTHNVTGVVSDAYTQKPIENCKVFLIGSEASFSGGPAFNELDKITTGHDGSFAFSYKSNSNYQHYYLYAVPIDKYKYLLENSYRDYIEIPMDEKKTYKNIELLHCGYLKVNFHHTSPDTIAAIEITYDKGTIFDVNGNTVNLVYFPPFIDNRSETYLMQGNTNNTMFITVSKKNPDGTVSTLPLTTYTLFTIPHDTSYYQFNY